MAEAEIIEAKGHAEATALKVRAGAYQDYNQAAVLDRLLSELPAVVRAAAEPLNNVDRITVISTGADGVNGGTGVNRITNDLSALVAQVPALVESLTGVNLQDLLKHVPTANNQYTERDVPVARKPGTNNPNVERVDVEPITSDTSMVQSVPVPTSVDSSNGSADNA